MEHAFALACLWGLGALAVLSFFSWLFTKIPNPFDELDDDDIKEIEDAGKNILDISGNDMFK